MEKEEKPKSASSIVYSFDDAIKLCGNGLFQKCLLLIVGLCLLSVISEIIIVGIYATIARCDIGFTLSQQGILSSAAYLGIVVAAYPWGYIADKAGRLKVIRIATVGGLVTSIISTFSTTVWMLISLRFIVGLFIAGTQVSAFSYLGEFHSIKTRTKAVTLLSVFITLGLTVPPALAIYVLPVKFNAELFGKPISSWRLLGIIATIPTILASCFLPFLPESPKFYLAIGKPEKAIRVLQLVFHINQRQPKDEYPVTNLAVDDSVVESSKQSFIGRMKQIIHHTGQMFHKTRLFTTLNLLLQIFGIYFVSYGLNMWFPTILSWMINYKDDHLTVYEIIELNMENSRNERATQLNCDAPREGITYEVLTMTGLFFTFVYLVITALIKVAGKRLLLCTVLLLTGAAGMSLYWVKGMYICMILFGLFIGCGNAGGVISTIAVEYYPTQINAMAMCLIMLIGRLGALLASYITGWIILENPNIMFYGFGSSIIILSVLAIFLPSDQPEKDASNEK